jgi:MscS family membrane protein
MPAVLVNVRFAGNELWRLLVFFGIVLLALVAGRLGRFVLERAAGRMAGGRRQGTAVALRAIARSTVVLALAVGLRLAAAALRVSEALRPVMDTALDTLLAAGVGYGAYCLADVIDHFLAGWAGRTSSRVDDMLVPLVGKSVRITIVVLVAVQVIEELSDKPITALVAGLGVGGLAIALAGQDTIKNFFGSLVIVADKPFEIGDRVVIDGHDGPVESVGFRSTRVRTLDGHLVTIPNGELVNKTIQNVGKRPYIRRVVSITITYDTPPAKVRRAVEILKEILDGHEGMDPELPPRVFFTDFNDCSLGIMMIYWYHPPDYWKYTAFSERVNHEILERFNAEGIEFAFPTRTVYVAGDPRRPLDVTAGRDMS